MFKRIAFLLSMISIFLLYACRSDSGRDPGQTPTRTPIPADHVALPMTNIPSETQDAKPTVQIHPAISFATSIQALAISPDAKHLAVGTPDAVYLIDKSSWQVVWQSGLSKANNAVAFSADGHIVCATSDSGRITLWEVDSPKPVRVLSGPQGSAGGAAFSPDGRLFAAGFSQIIQVWDAQNWQKSLTLNGHNNVIWRLAFSYDSRTLASASTDQTILLWDMTQKWDEEKVVPRKILRSPTYWLRSIAFSPDDRTIAAGSGDGVAYIWDAADAARLFTLVGEQGFIWDVAYAPAGNRLAAASDDGSVVMWNAQTGEMLEKWQYQKPVLSLLFDPLSQAMIAGFEDGNILIIPYS